MNLKLYYFENCTILIVIARFSAKSLVLSFFVMLHENTSVLSIIDWIPPYGHDDTWSLKHYTNQRIASPNNGTFFHLGLINATKTFIRQNWT